MFNIISKCYNNNIHIKVKWVKWENLDFSSSYFCLDLWHQGCFRFA